MIKAMTIAQTRIAYPVGTLVEITRTGQQAKVDDYTSGSVAFIGRRTFVHLVDPVTGKSLCEVTAESIRSI